MSEKVRNQTLNTSVALLAELRIGKMGDQQPTTSKGHVQAPKQQNAQAQKAIPVFPLKSKKVPKLTKPKTSSDYFANFRRYRVQRVKKDVLDKLDLQKTRHELLCEFFEIAIHNILFYRELYPSSLFERMKKYGVVVWIARHPAIKDYVENCINGMKPLLYQQKIYTLYIAVIEPLHNTPVERFGFQINDDQAEIPEWKDPNPDGSSPDSDEDFIKNLTSLKDPRTKKKFLFRFSQILKAFILKIAVCKAYLKPLPPDCRAELQIEVDSATQRGMLNDPVLHQFPWVEVDTRSEEVPNGEIQSIRGPTVGICNVEMFVEEVPNKFLPMCQAAPVTDKQNEEEESDYDGYLEVEDSEPDVEEEAEEDRKEKDRQDEEDEREHSQSFRDLINFDEMVRPESDEEEEGEGQEEEEVNQSVDFQEEDENTEGVEKKNAELERSRSLTPELF
ncbi:hypothetical protein RvY_12202-2 [Ramazzottius varieornatus]|uniref:HORMA domain-containing protein n=1 Tax=Ramazzottius varieornatus TaxID=947166 RepID=A0A1D1VP44_RAMVA|nr:hypothetical protein RvY_12202-2 [Ramazzottius varieornatus]